MASDILKPRLALLLLTVAVLTGCASRQQNPVLLGPDLLYERAVAAYEAEDYGDATKLLGAFVEAFIADPRAPEARLMLGRAHMERSEYVTAATHFTRLVNDFPSSPHALPARLGTCEAYYMLSPKPPLDQEYTQSAIIQCQSVVNYYPGTEEAAQAQAWVDEMQEKLARKTYDTGIFYQKRNALDASIVYFEEVLERFPDSIYAPRALAKMVEVYQQLGYVEDAEEARDRLRTEYPESAEAQALDA